MSSRLNSCWQTGDHLLSFITWPLTTTIWGKVRLSSRWVCSNSCYCCGPMDAFSLLIQSVIHSTNVYWMPTIGRFKILVAKWWAKWHNLCFHEVYSLSKKYLDEHYPCSGQAHLLEGLWRRGPRPGGSNEGRAAEGRLTSKMSLGELSGRRKCCAPGPARDVKADCLECWEWGDTMVRSDQGGKDGPWSVASGFEMLSLSARKRQRVLGKQVVWRVAFWSLLSLLVGEGLQGTWV